MNPPRLELVGQRFGRLTVLSRAPSRKYLSMWVCRCDCGAQTMVYQSGLRSGTTTSCGCFHKEVIASISMKHGHTANGDFTLEYKTWAGIRKRASGVGRSDYSGRGIFVCEEWNDFNNFLRDMGPRPGPEYSIDRIDNSKGYQPGNCRWATQTEQARNKRNNVLYEIKGVSRTLPEWSEISGVKTLTIYQRIHTLGWDIETAVFKPPRKISPRSLRASNSQ